MSESRAHPAKTTPLQPSRNLPPRDALTITNNFSVVGVGASAGGLNACKKLVAALPPGSGMAFILVQHLDPTHESMIANLLAEHTSLIVREAAEGMPVEREHLYIIPPGTYLSVSNRRLHLSEPEAQHGARLPFDFLLQSLAEEYGERAVGVILSGTGADGSIGLKAIQKRGGFIVAQDPEEADYDGMPRSAIMTGTVNLVLPVAKIAGALVTHDQQNNDTHTVSRSNEGASDWLPEIIDLLRAKTAHDFTPYKRGTLQRRIERRIGMTGIEIGDARRYLDILRRDANELDLLMKDLLINVTSFFRDSEVFEFLAEKIVPELVNNQPADHPLRIWIAGCSTGEECYSLVMLFLERIAAEKSNVKLQVFATDLDPDAIATAREGFYAETIESHVSKARLARFFSKEEHGYRILPELRAAVVFAVQDILVDPPFSRIDLVSCRNLLIYLRPEAQTKVFSVFHFALRKGGVLLLGNAEAVTDSGRFDVISKPARLYRRIGSVGAHDSVPLSSPSDSVRVSPRPSVDKSRSRQTALADLCRRLVMENHTPAALLINRKHEVLYSMGPIDRYLRAAPGHPTQDLFAMAHRDLRIKLRSAIDNAVQTNGPVVIDGGRVNQIGLAVSLKIEVRPIVNDGDELLLVCFVDEPYRERKQDRLIPLRDAPRVAQLEQELKTTKAELIGAIHNLEVFSEEQAAINEQALSANEEYQSANEELVTSKEELQSLNEELTALNGQLQETLERQRTTSNDLQNVLYSTNVATLFLDTQLNIRFLTPATTTLFHVIPGDVGRPAAELSSLAADGALVADAQTVLATLTPVEREIEGRAGTWYIRRILPYLTQENGVEGVVITFADITDRRHAADALEAAKRQAQMADVAKTRFLAAASHDLRQPLQTLALLQGLLATTGDPERAKKLVARLGETLGAMSGMLNTLLDINQIEAGTVRAELVNFPINGLLARMRDEFSYHAQARGLSLRVVPCSLSVHSDPRLLEQMIRNLVSNALKYTKTGKVLLGCRRRGGILRIGIWDTGIGILDDQLEAIFEEYHQVDNAARERGRGLGLGLAIVQRLASLLDHRIAVRSQPGKGSLFTVDVLLPSDSPAPRQKDDRPRSHDAAVGRRRAGAILVVEDDHDVRELLELSLKEQGHCVTTAPDGPTAIKLLERGTITPDLILADFNLPNKMNGLEVTAILRDRLRRQTPAIILTGDISIDTLQAISRQDCVQLNKPVELGELTQAIQQLLPRSPPPLPPRMLRSAKPATGNGPTIFVVDDDHHICEAIRNMLEQEGRSVETYASSEAFLDAYRTEREGCLVIDAYLPGMSGLELLHHLRAAGTSLPAIMITGKSDVSMAVHAMKAGALDFIEKPVDNGELLSGIERALKMSRDSSELLTRRKAAASRIATLTPRERQIMDLVVAGHASKNIAADLRVSQRTVENHRNAIMKKTGSKSLPALARLALTAAWPPSEEPAAQHAPTPDAPGKADS